MCVHMLTCHFGSLEEGTGAIYCSLLTFLRQSLSLSPKLTMLTGLTCQRAPDIFFVPSDAGAAGIRRDE